MLGMNCMKWKIGELSSTPGTNIGDNEDDDDIRSSYRQTSAAAAVGGSSGGTVAAMAPPRQGEEYTGGVNEHDGG